MSHDECELKADEIRETYNPRNLTPFPYKNVEDKNSDLKIFVRPFDDDVASVSGVTIYDTEDETFAILINENRPQNRQNFTIAHELGHYFLHKDYIKEKGIVVDDDKNKKVLYRDDESKRSQIEIEADNFAAALLMPKFLVKDAWKRLGDIQDCAKVFEVSAIAMSIRLERLGLIDN